MRKLNDRRNHRQQGGSNNSESQIDTIIDGLMLPNFGTLSNNLDEMPQKDSQSTIMHSLRSANAETTPTTRPRILTLEEAAI